MFGFKEAMILASVMLCIANAGKRNAQCDLVCQGKMTIECCECIGCHQGMRFGKRGMAISVQPEMDSMANGRRGIDMSMIEEALAQLEFDMATRPRRLVGKIYQ